MSPVFEKLPGRFAIDLNHCISICTLHKIATYEGLFMYWEIQVEVNKETDEQKSKDYRSTPKLFIASLFWILLVCVGCTSLKPTEKAVDDSEEDGGITENGTHLNPATSTPATIPPNSVDGENIDSATDPSGGHDGETNTPNWRSGYEEIAADGGSRDGDIVDGRADASATQYGCEQEGGLRCVANASTARQVCKNGLWQNADNCKDDEICDTSNTESPGTCVSSISLCEGRASEFICVNGVMHECNVDGISTSQQSCESQLHCQTGIPLSTCAVCIPGIDHKCEQQELLQCDSSGMGYVPDETCSTEAPCNAEAGACTNLYCIPNTYRCSGGILYRCNDDGSALEDPVSCDSGICDQTNGQCDVCIASQDRKCIDNNLAVCNSEGQDWDIDSCDEEYPYCVKGICKKCGTDADCKSAPDCMRAICTPTGCQNINDSDAYGKVCDRNGGQGYCNATGQCLECLQGEDCRSPTAPVCSDGVCIACNATTGCNTGVCAISALDPTLNECVGCQGPGDCAPGLSCVSKECQEPPGPRCGNNEVEAGEQCDDGSSLAPSISGGRVSNYDGCGPECNIHWTWGCRLINADPNDLRTFLKRELEDGNSSVPTWVWSLPNGGQSPGHGGTLNERSTCAGPCRPVFRQGDETRPFGYCDNSTGPKIVDIAGSSYQLTCINGACVIPCKGSNKTCPSGYTCAPPNHRVLDMQGFVDVGDNQQALIDFVSDSSSYVHFDYCMADAEGDPPFRYADE